MSNLGSTGSHLNPACGICQVLLLSILMILLYAKASMRTTLCGNSLGSAVHTSIRSVILLFKGFVKCRLIFFSLFIKAGYFLMECS